MDAGFPKNELFFFFATFKKDKAALLQLPNVNSSVINAALLGTQYAITDAAQLVYLGSIAVSAMALICACFLPNIKQYMTDQVVQKTVD